MKAEAIIKVKGTEISKIEIGDGYDLEVLVKEVIALASIFGSEVITEIRMLDEIGEIAVDLTLWELRDFLLRGL